MANDKKKVEQLGQTIPVAPQTPTPESQPIAQGVVEPPSKPSTREDEVNRGVDAPSVNPADAPTQPLTPDPADPSKLAIEPGMTSDQRAARNAINALVDEPITPTQQAVLQGAPVIFVDNTKIKTETDITDKTSALVGSPQEKLLYDHRGIMRPGPLQQHFQTERERILNPQRLEELVPGDANAQAVSPSVATEGADLPEGTLITDVNPGATLPASAPPYLAVKHVPADFAPLDAQKAQATQDLTLNPKNALEGESVPATTTTHNRPQTEQLETPPPPNSGVPPGSESKPSGTTEKS